MCDTHDEKSLFPGVDFDSYTRDVDEKDKKALGNAIGS